MSRATFFAPLQRGKGVTGMALQSPRWLWRDGCPRALTEGPADAGTATEGPPDAGTAKNLVCGADGTG